MFNIDHKNMRILFIKFILCIIFCSVSLAQNNQLKFEQYSTEQGLSQSTVNCIYRDHKGFLWVGTVGGLHRFDGYSFKIFRPVPGDTNGFKTGSIGFINPDKSNPERFLWVGTEDGLLYQMDLETEQIKHISLKHNDQLLRINSLCHDKKDGIWLGTVSQGVIKIDANLEIVKQYANKSTGVPNLRGDFISDILCSENGLLWIGLPGIGVDCLNPLSGKIFSISSNSPNDHTLSSNSIQCIFEDRNNQIWIGTKEGLNQIKISYSGFPPDSQTVSSIETYHYTYDPKHLNGISSNSISRITEDINGDMWLATYGGGLNKFDSQRKRFTHYRHDPLDPYSIPNNEIKYVYSDTLNAILWFGTDGGGLGKLNLASKKFNHYTNQPNDPNNLTCNTIGGLMEARDGSIWICTQSCGIEIFRPGLGVIKRFRYHPNVKNSIPSDRVLNCYRDSKDQIWIGTSNGLAKYNAESNDFKRFKLKDENTPEIDDITILAIQEEFSPRNEILWLGTYQQGIVQFNCESGQVENYTHLFNQIKGGITVIYKDWSQSGPAFWVGTYGNGLYYVDNSNMTIKNYTSNSNAGLYISDNTVWSILRDTSGDLWIGTDNGGLNKYDAESDNFKYLSQKDGIPSLTVSSIVEDSIGNLWLGTYKGISKFSPKKRQFLNYDIHDGIGSNEFWVWAYLKDSSGNIYFGGNNGLCVFHPDNIINNPKPPEIVISDLTVFNESVDMLPNITLKKTIPYLNNIQLNYHQNFIAFEFSALDFTAPLKNRYAYKMEGVDPDWVYTDANRRYASYTQLSPGDYTFKIRGSNNDQTWNHVGASITISISPPWWKTTWAYILYVIFFLSIVITIWKLQINRLKVINSMEMERLTTAKLKEIDAEKSRFFANISHEFRTPLTLIESPIKLFLDGELKGNLKEHCKIVLKNTRRLLELVNQLLDIAKFESGRVKLRTNQQNLIPLIKGLVQSFESLAYKRDIKYRFNTNINQVDIFIDTEKVEKIIINLLSNAFKYTPDEGEISVKVKLDKIDADKTSSNSISNNFVAITILNSGPGIPPEQIDKVFDRFFQVNESGNGNLNSSGIGLALTKEYVELHSGLITVSSEPGKITSFIVYLPLGREHLSDDEVINDVKINTHNKDFLAPEIGAHSKEILFEKPVSSNNTKILIVEDNNDVLNYITGILEQEYKIVQAENGLIGLHKAQQYEPDLIISDVMMPEMDGYDLCRQIKQDIEISHIPVILLTARVTQQEKNTGLDCGADDYIIKPFEARELLLRVRNTLNLRKRIIEKLKQEIEFDISSVTATTTDKIFLTKLIECVNTIYSKSDISMQDVAREIGFSLATLTRKTKGLLDMTPAEFLRTFRLKKARELLLLNHGNISEIVFKVGFNSLSYFGRCYKKQFGISPSQEILQKSQ